MHTPAHLPFDALPFCNSMDLAKYFIVCGSFEVYLGVFLPCIASTVFQTAPYYCSGAGVSGVSLGTCFVLAIQSADIF